MKNKLILIFIFIINFIIYGNEELKVQKIKFYGTFVSHEYLDKKGNFVGPGGEVTKLPICIDAWPADDTIDAPPEIIIIMGEFINNSKTLTNYENINISARFKVSKIIYDENNEMDIEKSKKNQYWDKPFFTNSINIKNLKLNSKIEKELLRFNIYDLISTYDSKGLNPWMCEVTIKNSEGIKFVKTFQIGIVW